MTDELRMDKIIEHSEAVARGALQPLFDSEEECREYVEDQRLIAVWLKELKRHREAWKKLKDAVVAYHNNFDYATAMRFLNIIDERLSEIGSDGNAD